MNTNHISLTFNNFLCFADDGKDDTEGEEFKKARELRREEVRLQPLPVNLPTDTETEVSLLEFLSLGYGKLILLS